VQKNCCISVTTMEDQEIRQRREHSHEEDLTKPFARKVKSNLTASVHSTRQIAAKALLMSLMKS